MIRAVSRVNHPVAFANRLGWIVGVRPVEQITRRLKFTQFVERRIRGIHQVATVWRPKWRVPDRTRHSYAAAGYKHQGIAFPARRDDRAGENRLRRAFASHLGTPAQ